MIKKALVKAYEIHCGQTRKGGKYPYFVHILDSCKYLMYETDDEEVICAGLLHDALEDSCYTKEDLRKDFGQRVYSLVMFCTEPENKPDSTAQEQKNTWKKRKQHSIDILKNGTEEELLVFLADKVSNLLAMNEDIRNSDKLWSRFNASKEDIAWYYLSIKDAVKGKLEHRRIFSVYDWLLGIFD